MSEPGAAENLVENNFKKEEQRFVEGLHEYHQAHYKILKEHLRENPDFDKSGVLLYHASGSDIATFLGSGLGKAYYVDIGYSFLDLAGNSALEELKAEVGRVDPNYKTLQEENFKSVSGEIEFFFQGAKKIIRFEGRDATDYVPEGIGKVSLFASIGCSTELERPPTQAEAYYVSLLFPRALGFDNCYLEKNSGTLAFKYEDLGLSDNEREIIEAVNFQSTSFLKIKNFLETNDIKGLKSFRNFLITKANMENRFFEPLGDFFIRDFNRRFGDLSNIRPEIKKLLSKDLVNFFNPLLENKDLNPSSRGITIKLINYFNSL